MPSPEAAPSDEHQEVKSPMGPGVKKELSSILGHPEKSPNSARPCSLAGQKRQMSPSPQASPRKRYSFPAATPHNVKPLEEPQPEEKGHCSSCGFPCWRCKTPLNLPNLHENQAPEDESVEPPSRPASAQASTSASTPASETTLTTNKKRKIWEAKGLTFVDPKDEKFDMCILIPCGMVLGGSETSDLTPSTIFGTQTSVPSSRVLLHKTDEELQDIIGDLNERKNRLYDEPALAMICVDSIILRDRNRFNNLFDEAEFFKAERRDKWKPHKEGPRPGGAYVYDWDLEPDATYTVSIRTFNAQDRFDLRFESCQRWLAEETSACPYLTIEYKVSEKTGKRSHAVSQNAAASML